MLDVRKTYYTALDKKAQVLVQTHKKKQPVTEAILNSIIEMYKSAKVEHEFHEPNFFKSASHSPITSEFEFFIARFLYHYSKINNLNWMIKLRCKEKSATPDIRIIRNEEVLAVIEIKAKAGYIQSFLSPERYKYDVQRLKSKETKFNPDNLIKTQKNQLDNYRKTFSLDKSRVFFLLPTMALVHRERYKTTLNDYYKYFEKTSCLPKDNFILLSENLRLDLSVKHNDLQPTDNFEKMLVKLSKL